MNNYFDLGVIGGGIVGLASAYKIQLRNPHLNIAIFEKEKTLAAHQTGRNSGVIHSGLYYDPKSYRAKNCVSGRKQLIAFAKEHNIQHDICGKIIVATNKEESKRLPFLVNRGLKNGLTGLEIINRKQSQDIEPYVNAESSIWVPETGEHIEVTCFIHELQKSGLEEGSQISIKIEKKFDVDSLTRDLLKPQ